MSLSCNIHGVLLYFLAFLDDAIPQVFTATREVFQCEADNFLDRLLRSAIS